MLVRERMSRPVISMHPDVPIQEALTKMKKENIRRTPVVDARGKLVGIISESDLLHASPSDATSLSVWELNYLLSKIQVQEVMTRQVITIGEDTPIEEAARIMADNKIGGLPVMREDHVVGIITETDLFKVFLELFGARDPGVRLTALIPNMPGELAKLTSAVAEKGANIIAIGSVQGENTETSEITMKIENLSLEDIKKIVDPIVARIIDLRKMD